jgi:Kef-type K+ transport system membrane component KefB
MDALFAKATLWFALALVATVLAYRLHISLALIEICVGIFAGWLATTLGFPGLPGSSEEWLRFIASTGSILLTFLAGAELNTDSIKVKWKESLVVGLIGFCSPFVGGALLAKFLLHWTIESSLLGGIALSTTSMAVVYSVLLEFGLNKKEFGKGILGACFVNDLATVVALSLIFSPMNWKMLVFVAAVAAGLAILPGLINRMTRLYGHKTAAIRTKLILFVLFGSGALAVWSGSEAVLPAYIAGIVLANFLEKDNFFVRRIRTMTVGFMTPVFFIRAGSLVSVSSFLMAPLVFLYLFGSKIISKIIGLYPIISTFRGEEKERKYYTLLMSTGLTFGTISALFGLSHGIIDEAQYSALVLAVIASAVIPTAIANRFFLPKHLLAEGETAPQINLSMYDVEAEKSKEG